MKKFLILILLLAMPGLLCGQSQFSGGGNSTSSNPGLGAGAMPALAYGLSPFCTTANTAQCYNTAANTQVQQNCSFSTTVATITCASGTFAPGDVGKKLMGSAGCNPFTSNIPMAYAAPVTITGFTSNATVATSAVALINTTLSGCVVWGTPDDPAASALETFFATGSNTGFACPKVWLAAAGYWFNQAHFFNNPAGCSSLPGLAGGGTFGNLFLSEGFEVEGRGPGATILWLPPDFPEAGGCLNGVLSNTCWGVPLEGRFGNFQIASVSNNAGTNIPNGGSLMGVDVGTLEYFTCTNVHDFQAGNSATGLQATHWARMSYVNISNCGDTNLNASNGVGGAQIYGTNIVLENAFGLKPTSANLLTNAASFTCIECRFFGSQTSSAISAIVQNGGNLILYRPTIQPGVGAASMFAYQCLTAGCKVTMTDANIIPQGTNSTGFFCNVTCTIDLERSSVTAAGTGAVFNVNTSAASTIFNRGGNIFTGGAANTISGMVLNLDSVGNAQMVAGDAVLSANWGTGAAWSAINGGNSFTGTITNGTTTGAAPTIALTFPTPLLATPNICVITQIGGTNAVGTFALSAGTLTKTGGTFTFSLTPTASSTEIVQVFCQ